MSIDYEPVDRYALCKLNGSTDDVSVSFSLRTCVHPVSTRRFTGLSKTKHKTARKTKPKTKLKKNPKKRNK